jgi:hypothetical protein
MLPAQLRTPKIASKWIWRIDSPHARTLVEVVDVRHNGEEWWVYLRKLLTDVAIDVEMPDVPASGVYPILLGWFWESATPVGGWPEELSEEEPSAPSR